MGDPTFHPWPGHPCASHGCDGCAICQSGNCCGGHAIGTPVTTDSLVNWRAALHRLVTQGGAPIRPSLTSPRPLATLVATNPQAEALPSATVLPSPAFAFPQNGAAA